MKTAMVCFFFVLSTACFSQAYVENFNGQNGKGVTAVCGDEDSNPNMTETNIPGCPNYDVSGTNWVLSGSTRMGNVSSGNTDHANVVNGAFEFNDVDEEVCIDLKTLDISGAIGTIDISAQVTSGGMEPSDYVSIKYSIDGGALNTVTETGNATGISVTGLSGTSTLDVSVCADNSANTETYTIDNITITPQGGTVIILPIELLSFRIERKERGVLVSWKTAVEINNDYMIVERSKDGREFLEIGRVKGGGTTSEVQSYSHMDDRPLNGINYYRLRQVDFDGRQEIHRVANVYWNETVDGISIYPNPTNQFLEVNLNEDLDHGMVWYI